MPTLFEDYVEETNASHRRLADRLGVEAWELEKLKQSKSAAEDVQEVKDRAVQSARQATEVVVSQLPPAKDLLRIAAIVLRMNPSKDLAKGILGRIRNVYLAGQLAAERVCAIWELAEHFGIAPERLDELQDVSQQLENLANEAERAIDHWTAGWKPSDSDRMELGMKLARKGETVNAREARARFCAGSQ